MEARPKAPREVERRASVLSDRAHQADPYGDAEERRAPCATARRSTCHMRAQRGVAPTETARRSTPDANTTWIVTIEEAPGTAEASGDAAEAEGAERGGIASDASREFRHNGASEADEEPVAERPNAYGKGKGS